jgi:putative acetyltransferase
VTVRPERADEHAAIHAVHAAAFAPSTVEAPLLDALRADGDLLPALSFTAEADGAVVGHVAISRAWVAPTPPDTPGTPPDDVEVLALGPIGVLPAHQGRGVGAALMRAVLTAAGATAYPLIALLGHASYYPRFGFEEAAPLGLRCPYPVPSEVWLAYRLPAYDPAVRGAFRYAPAFAAAS